MTARAANAASFFTVSTAWRMACRSSRVTGFVRNDSRNNSAIGRLAEPLPHPSLSILDILVANTYNWSSLNTDGESRLTRVVSACRFARILRYVFIWPNLLAWCRRFQACRVQAEEGSRRIALANICGLHVPQWIPPQPPPQLRAEAPVPGIRVTGDLADKPTPSAPVPEEGQRSPPERSPTELRHDNGLVRAIDIPVEIDIRANVIPRRIDDGLDLGHVRGITVPVRIRVAPRQPKRHAIR